MNEMQKQTPLIDLLSKRLQKPLFLPEGGILGLNFRSHLGSKAAIVDLLAWTSSGIIRRFLKEYFLSG